MNFFYNQHGSNLKSVEKYISDLKQVEMKRMREIFHSIPFEEFQDIIYTLKKASLIENKNGILFWNK